MQKTKSLKRTYQPAWEALKKNGIVELKMLNLNAQATIVRGVSKEKNQDPNKPAMQKIFTRLTRKQDGTYLVLELRTVTKTRGNDFF